VASILSLVDVQLGSEPVVISCVKRHLVILAAVAVLALSSFGCHRSYPESQLVGSWQSFTNRITQTYTFYPNHTFVSAIASSSDLRNFGDWTLDQDQLTITLRSNSFSSIAASNRTTAQIAKLTDAVLILKDRDKNEDLRVRAFRRLKGNL
jgi:hypothetical protein